MTQYDYYTTIGYNALFGLGVIGATAFALAAIYALFVLFPYVRGR